MRKHELPGCPQWLLDANTAGEDVIIKRGALCWLGGDFRGGDFRGGNFQGGNFRGGDFWGGDFFGNKNPHQFKIHLDWGPALVFVGGGADFIRIRIGCRFFKSFREAISHWHGQDDRIESLKRIKAFQQFINKTIGPRT